MQTQENDILTFRRLRKSIGYFGMGLPVILVVFSLIPFFQTQVQASISLYYYTNLREFLTGVLCAVGLFLIRYKGVNNHSFWKNDSLLTNIAGYMAFGVALFPTNPDFWCQKIYTLIPLDCKFLGVIHYFFATTFFLVTAIISIKIFTLGQKESDLPMSLINENNIYRTCGYLIIFFLLMIPLFAYLKVFKYSTLLFEALSLFAFGISWLIKGRALGDKGAIGRKIYREVN